MTDRQQQIVVLLRTRDEGLPEPKTWTGQLVLRAAVRGETPTKRTACGSCRELGMVAGRQGPERCDRCNGRGWYLVDAYTGQREREERASGPFTGSERGQWRRRIDANIARLKADERERERKEFVLADLADVQPEPWERERRRLYAQGDYARLDRALDALRIADSFAHSVFRRVWAADVVVLEAWPDAVQHSAVRGMNFVDRLMPDPIKVPQRFLPTEASLAYGERRAKRAA